MQPIRSPKHVDRRPLTIAASLLLAVASAVLAAGPGSPQLGPVDGGDAPVTPGGVAAVLANQGAAAERARAARGAYQLAVGDGFAVDVELATTATMTQGDAKPVGVTSRLAGRLTVVVADARADELALLARMDAAAAGTANSAPAAVAALRATLAEGFVVRLGRDGALRGYRFPATATAEHRNLVRTLAQALRAEVGAGAATFTATTADATGVAQVEGEWNDGRTELRRRKLAYTPAGLMTPTVDGRGVLTLDPATGWWDRAEWREAAVVVVAEAKLRIEARAEATAGLVAGSATFGGHVDAFDWGLPWAPASGAGDSDGGADPESIALAGELRGVALRTLFDRMAALLAGGGTDEELHEARRRAIWLLRNDPRALLDLQALAADPTAPAALVAEALSAAGAADTAATQRVLAQLAGERGAPTVRVAALHALFQVGAADAATFAALAAIQADADAPAELHGTSLLLHGALADERARGDAPIADLLARERFAVERGLAVDWLEALGNSGREAVRDAGLRYLASTDVRERAAAVSALRRLADERSLTALAGAATTDDATIVRVRAVDALAMRAGATALATLERVARQDADAMVRSHAVQALAARPEREAAAQTLAQLAASDPSAQVREQAAAAAAALRGKA
jgi:hypothetical protein